MAAGEAGNIVERAICVAFADVEKYAPQEFKEILQADPQKKELIKQAVKQTAEEEVKLAAEFRKQASTPEEITKRLKSHYSENRLRLVKTALQVPTYRLEISKRHDNHHWVSITRNEKKFKDPIRLDNNASISTAKWIQIASIVIEAVLLLLQVADIEVAVDESTINKMADEMVVVIEESSLLQKAIANLQVAVKSGSSWEIAKAIFYLIKDCYIASILWQIIKSLCSNMSKWEWLKTGAIVTAMVTAAVATGGVALIAKIVLALDSAYVFLQKVNNLDLFEDIRKDLQSQREHVRLLML